MSGIERFKPVIDECFPYPCCGRKEIRGGFESAISMGVPCRGCGLLMERHFPDEWDREVDIELVTLEKAVKAWNERVQV